MRKMRAYLELPWSIEVEERHDDGSYFVARVGELPGLVATGETREELDSALWEAIEDHVRSYLEDDQQPPLPPGAEAAFEIIDRSDRQADHVFLVDSSSDVSASTVSTQEKETDGGVLRDRDRNLEPMAG